MWLIDHQQTLQVMALRSVNDISRSKTSKERIIEAEWDEIRTDIQNGHKIVNNELTDQTEPILDKRLTGITNRGPFINSP